MICRFPIWMGLALACLFPALGLAQINSSAETYKTLIHNLLEQSLEYEIEAIKNQTPVNYGTRNVYFPQMRLRGKAGEHEQNARLFDALMELHEEPNRERSISFYETRIGRFADPASSLEGVSDLIREGQLDRVRKILENPQWSKQRTGESWQGVLNAERFWLACKLAAAYHREGSAEKVRECLNFTREIQEGQTFTGQEFDADDDWIPETPAEHRMSPSFQQRTTFYWTLVQAGHAELAIKWFLSDKQSQSKDAVFVSNIGPSKDLPQRFIALVASRHSPQRASELARQVYGKSIPAQVHADIVNAALSADEITVATSHIKETLRTLADEPIVVLKAHCEMLGSLIQYEQHEFASVLLDALIGRIERFENAVRAGQTPTVLQENDQWRHVLYAFLASEAVKFDKDAALKLVDLFEQAPGKEEWQRWVLIESIKARCGTISKEKQTHLTESCFADELIGAYLDSDQDELSRRTMVAAAVRVRKITHSGNWISGKGLAVLDYNAHERILLARRAVHFKDYQLARELLDEIQSDYARREGYRAVTLRITKTYGIDRAQAWIEETENSISKSGAILGLVEFLLPDPEELDEIPKAYEPGC